MSHPRKLHLFNCDRTYKLDAVEGLLNGMKVKLGFESVERHNFSLSQMSEMSTKTIPELQMDLAFFVVHAHESRLSINEDNAGIGYAKIYRALLEKTGGNVIIVIGGDDNYKNEDEEERVVISRWARRKISSQFNEEFLDGRKSFIFSWNKKHREIHEEALLHYFDPKKKGQKFEYQPKPKPKQAGSEPSGHRSPLQKAESMYEQRTVDRNPLQRAKTVTEPITADSFFSSFSSAEQRREDSSFSNISIPRANTLPFDSGKGARSKEMLPSSTGTTELKELAVLGCNVSNDSMQAVRKVLEAIVPKLKLSESPPVVNLPPDEAKWYLTENKLKFCVLVVDAGTFKDAYENPPQRKVEYKRLLETAVDKVVAKVIILLCDTCSLLPKDKAIVDETIEPIINKMGGYKVWLKNGKLEVHPDVLVQFLISTSTVAQSNPQRDFQTSTDVASGTVADLCGTTPPLERDLTSQPWHPPVKTARETVMLKTKLRKGRISYQRGDVQTWYPGFQVPDHIIQSLGQKHFHTAVAVVKIVFINGDLQWSVNIKSKESPEDEGIQIAANETLMLHARVRYGQLSLEKGDLEFISPDWETPKHIIETLQRDYWATPNGELFIISDEKGNLRRKVNIARKDQLFSLGNKAKGALSRSFRN